MIDINFQTGAVAFTVEIPALEQYDARKPEQKKDEKDAAFSLRLSEWEERKALFDMQAKLRRRQATIRAVVDYANKCNEKICNPSAAQERVSHLQNQIDAAQNLATAPAPTFKNE